jgi:hypothetical protein
LSVTVVVFGPVKPVPVRCFSNFPPFSCSIVKLWSEDLSEIANLYVPALSVLT